MATMLATLMPLLPWESPNHLLGIGDIESIDIIVKLGIDTFDSSHPTRCARHGLLFLKGPGGKFAASDHVKIFNPAINGLLNRSIRHAAAIRVIHYTAAYIHHLFKAKE